MYSARFSPLSRKTVSFLILGAWLTLIALINTRILAEKVDLQVPPDEPPFVWQSDLYRFLAFGHVPAAVDSLLLKFLVEENIKHVEAGVRAKVYYFLDLATDLDPAFLPLYTAGTNFLAVARNDKASALKLITKGEEFRRTGLLAYPKQFQDTYWRDAWRIPFIQGYVHLFEMNDLPAAAKAYRKLEDLPGVPEPIRDLAKRFEKPGGQYEVGLNVLTGMILAEEDERIRKELERRRDSLALSYDLFKLNESFRAFPKQPGESPQDRWSRFRGKFGIPDHDPRGGAILLRDNETIDSTTPRIPVLGLK